MDVSVLRAIDPQLLGERLSSARRARSMTQAQVAELVGIARTTLVAIEKGDRRPKASELIQLSRVYGREVRSFVSPLVPQVDNYPGFVVRFRKASDRHDRSADDDIYTFERICNWYFELEEMLGQRLSRRYPEVYDVSGSSPDNAGEEVASSERNRLGLGDGPLGDIGALLEMDVGLKVFSFGMKNSYISGMFVFSSHLGGCISLNANQPYARLRRSICHEYGHFLTDRYRAEISVFQTRGRLAQSERLANAFARYFLMPEDGLKRRFERLRREKSTPITPADVLQLGHLYGVSFQAMMNRLEELGLLRRGSWEELQNLGFKPERAKASLGFHEEEKQALSVRYQTLAVQAFEKGLISEGRLAELLLVSRSEARDIVANLTHAPTQNSFGEWQALSLDLDTVLSGMG